MHDDVDVVVCDRGVPLYLFIKYPRNFRATIGQFEFIISP